ncbi:MAG: Na/Pi symporter [Propioniciclava sp.]|uniref:Na/Pi cotransporter family protein n=1 Tax=Propioniciclava sp. TaxID=2038686 RepID=UPI0039E5A785
MDVDLFKDVIVPVVGGLGIFLLGLEFMEKGIQSLSANKMRDLLSKMAGTPLRGVFAGTIITGVIQSSTAMTVMTVGLVNASVLSLRGAIGVIMGANIGTTLGNGLIALPLGPIGLLCAGVFATMYCFAKSDKTKSIALASMGFSLIFYGLNLLTGGLKPLRNMPQVMDLISGLDSSTIVGVLTCALIAALVTALIHSSSATIGIVMGLGASGVLDWQTAIAFAIGADLGTTITSWIASLNLSKNAKRTAYAHIMFNAVGVSVVLALFFPAITVLTWVMGFFGGDPGVPVITDGQETFPLVPVAVGLFSIFFNIFNVVIMFPFVNQMERFLLRIGHTSEEDLEDYTQPRYLDRAALADYGRAVPLMQAESARLMHGAAVFLDIARGKPDVPKDPGEHYAAVDALAREIREYSAHLFRNDLDRDQMNLVASMIEEVDFTGSLAETLNQIARRVKRERYSDAGNAFVETALGRLESTLHLLEGPETPQPHVERDGSQLAAFEAVRWGVIDSAEVPANEKGAIIALLGSIERAEGLVARVLAERASLDRDIAALIRPGRAASGKVDHLSAHPGAHLA